MSEVLVTGGAGFIGSHLVDALVARGHQVTIFDCLDPQVHPRRVKPSWLNPHARFVLGDVRDQEALAKVVHDVDVIFHQAAAVGVGQSQYQIKHYVDTNVGGTANLLDILANRPHRVRKLIVAASMSSYGEGLYRDQAGQRVRPPLRDAADVAQGGWEPRDGAGQPLQAAPTPEDAALLATSVYALTKRDQEDLVLTFGRTYQIPVVALRYFNVYGPRQSLSNPYTGVAAIFLSRLLNGRAPLIYEDGLQSRDFIAVEDIVAANLLAMERDGGDYRSINIGSGRPRTIRDVALALARACGRVEIEPELTGEFRKGDIRHCFPDLTLARQALGFTPQADFEHSLGALIEWSRQAEAIDRTDEAQQELRQRGLL